eukprot:m.187419 g.187419  ORF g.187419 m.187419 type:complete len:64 (+) comp17073_c0_seq1:114-305(+)
MDTTMLVILPTLDPHSVGCTMSENQGFVSLTPLAFMILTAAGGGCPGGNTVLLIMGQLVPWFK